VFSLWSVLGQQWANATVEVFFCGPIPGSECTMLARGVRKPARAMPGISTSLIHKVQLHDVKVGVWYEVNKEDYVQNVLHRYI
jgi:hypothetical protein